MYNYPLLDDWSTDEIIDVVHLYNLVEQAYEDKVNKSEFIEAYNIYVEIVNSKSIQKQLEKEFLKESGYSIYKVYQQSRGDNEWISL